MKAEFEDACKDLNGKIEKSDKRLFCNVNELGIGLHLKTGAFSNAIVSDKAKHVSYTMASAIMNFPGEVQIIGKNDREITIDKTKKPFEIVETDIRWENGFRTPIAKF